MFSRIAANSAMSSLRTLSAGLLSACLMTAGLTAVPSNVSAANPLTVCLEEDSPPYSFKFGKRKGGFDYDLAHALGEALGRETRILWFEFEIDEEEMPTLQAAALLADEQCDLIGGFPLLETWLDKPGQPTSNLPDYAGKTRLDRKRYVKLKPLIASNPYHRSQFGVIVSPNVKREIQSLDDLAGIRLIAEIDSLTGILLWRHNKGQLIDDLTHIRGKDGLFKQMDKGVGDATLTEVHRFERYRFRNADTKLRFSGYQHPLGYNFGYGALAEDAPARDLFLSRQHRVLIRSAVSRRMLNRQNKSLVGSFSYALGWLAEDI